MSSSKSFSELAAFIACFYRSDVSPFNRISSALRALCGIARSAEGAEAIVTAKALDLIPQWLSAGNRCFLSYACDLLNGLAGHDSTLSAIVRTVPRERLVFLLTDTYVQEKAEQLLNKIDAYLESHSVPSPELHVVVGI